MRRLMLSLLIMTGIAAPAAAAETRCGWYVNPTPGDLLLTDRDGDWWITTQGAAVPDAAGVEDHAPEFDPRQYVKLQPNGYGYGCACLDVDADRKEMRITRVYSGQILPLSHCRGDRALKTPE